MKNQSLQITRLIFSALLLLPCLGWGADYWQQSANYIINTKLDHDNHLLKGFQRISYTNNSPDTLS
ncbi:MAG: hypothetical protein SCK70_14850, partial [bacterium]|nr:hypothetical protein [bacterium]